MYIENAQKLCCNKNEMCEAKIQIVLYKTKIIGVFQKYTRFFYKNLKYSIHEPTYSLKNLDYH